MSFHPYGGYGYHRRSFLPDNRLRSSRSPTMMHLYPRPPSAASMSLSPRRAAFEGATGPTGGVAAPSRKQPPAVYFSAVMSAPNQSLPAPSNNAIVVFNQIAEGNFDGAYDASTGVFKAPRTGLYRCVTRLAYTSQNPLSNGTFLLSINVNGNPVFGAARGGTLYFENSFVNAAEANLSLIQGDAVTITQAQTTGLVGPAQPKFQSNEYPQQQSTWFSLYSLF